MREILTGPNFFAAALHTRRQGDPPAFKEVLDSLYSTALGGSGSSRHAEQSLILSFYASPEFG